MIKKECIGKIIKQLRNSKKLTQEELAEAVDMSTQYLSKVERGLCVPSAETFLKMAEVLSFTLQDFGIKLTEKDNKIKNELLNMILSASEKENEAYLKIIKVTSEIIQ